jgi:hypothetical protein
MNLEEIKWHIQKAEEAGFTVIDLSNVYSLKTEDILLASWDWYPNATGHQLIADQLYEQLLSRDYYL